jgi:hypothetical protein
MREQWIGKVDSWRNPRKWECHSSQGQRNAPKKFATRLPKVRGQAYKPLERPLRP